MATKKKIAKRRVKAPKKSAGHRGLDRAVVEMGSQAKLAKKLGCSQQSVSAWVKGGTPREKTQAKMHRVFGITGPWS